MGRHLARAHDAWAKFEEEEKSQEDAYGEFGVATEKKEFSFPQMTIWKEHVPVIDLFQYAIFKYSDYSGMIVGIDWPGVDVILKYENVAIKPEVFKDWRSMLNGYIEEANKNISTNDS